MHTARSNEDRLLLWVAPGWCFIRLRRNISERRAASKPLTGMQKEWARVAQAEVENFVWGSPVLEDLFFA